jgi:hypothetical protein
MARLVERILDGKCLISFHAQKINIPIQDPGTNLIVFDDSCRQCLIFSVYVSLFLENCNKHIFVKRFLTENLHKLI